MSSTSKWKNIILGFVCVVFLAGTLPLAFERPSGGRSAERQGYTAGMIRIYCQEPAHSILSGPQIHFGRNPFNLELSVFEWVQGWIARVVGGSQCDAVEPVGKVFSILCSAGAIVVIAFLGFSLWGVSSGLLAALLLASQEMWLRYSTYTMIENRVILCGALAILFSLKQRLWLASFFWTISFVQKPQIFLFMFVWWIGIVVVSPHQRKLCLSSIQKVVLSSLIAFSLGLIWFIWSAKINAQSDLPWIIQTGPQARRWYFGVWADRWTWDFWKTLVLSWVRGSQLHCALIALMVLFFPVSKLQRQGLKKTGQRSLWVSLAQLFRQTTPFLGAFLVLKFIFYHVYVAHEYYALSINFAKALISASVLATLFTQNSAIFSRFRVALVQAFSFFVVGYAVLNGATQYIAYASHVGDPNKDFYHENWNVQVFPKPSYFVVMAGPGNGHDLLHLYLAKQRGFVWCALNEKFAPRAFWKDQGVGYVAWVQGVDPKTGRYQWKIYTMEEELARARKNSWSSDIDDVWKNRSMWEWAALASQKNKDPCREGHFDPRLW